MDKTGRRGWAAAVAVSWSDKLQAKPRETPETRVLSARDQTGRPLGVSNTPKYVVSMCVNIYIHVYVYNIYIYTH